MCASATRAYRIFIPRADSTNSVPSSAVLFCTSSVGFTSTMSSARSRPGVGEHLHHHVRLAVVEAAFDRRADAWRDRRDRRRRGRTRRAGPRCRGPPELMACSMTAAMPARSMSFIVKTWMRESRTRCFSLLVQVPDADEHGVLRADLRGLKPPMHASSAGSGTEQRRQRHAVDVARLVLLAGRVHVAVRVDPDQAESARPRAAACAAARGDRPGREAVVPAEHERQRAPASRLASAAS